MSVSTTTTYETAGNFTFDSSLIEIVGNDAQLKSQISANETFYCDYTSSIDAIRSGGSATGTAGGSADVSGGKLDLNYNDVRYVSYVTTSNFDFVAGTIRWKYTPNYSGSPSANRYFFYMFGAGNINTIAMWHKTDGTINWTILDSSAVSKIAGNVAAWSPTLGQEYELELNIDSAGGSTWFAVDGIQLGSTDTTVFTRTSSVTTITVGTNNILNMTSNASFDDLQVFNSVQHTPQDFSSEVPRNITVYPTTAATILTNASFGATGLISAADVTTLSGSDMVKWTVYYEGVDHYLSGGVLAVSDGTYAQSNTAAELEAAMPLDIAPDGSVQMRAYLFSADGSTTPALTSNTMGYNFFTAMNTLNECSIWGYVYDNDTAVEGATIRFKGKSIQDVSGNWISIDREVRSNSTGYFMISLAETATSGVKLETTISFVNSRNKLEKETFDIIVPNSASSPLDDAKDLAL
jgi:hypothetical protein